jgi:hypothetical protein
MSRHNKRWNVNEELKLQREYELLNMTIQEIADSHERTEEAILCKLQKEGFIRSWNEATGYKEYEKSLPDFINLSYYQIVNETTSEEEEDEYNVIENNNINNNDQRLWTIINEIKNMVSALLYKREFSTV